MLQVRIIFILLVDIELKLLEKAEAGYSCPRRPVLSGDCVTVVMTTGCQVVMRIGWVFFKNALRLF